MTTVAVDPEGGDEPLKEAGEDDHWRAFKLEGSARAREQLFTLHFDFARGIARRHWLSRRGGEIEFQELCQLASAGLLEALDGYVLDRGASFRTYAARRISGSILDGLAKMSEVREQISLRNRVRAERLRSLASVEVAGLRADEALNALAELAVGLAIGFMLDEGLYVSNGDTERAPNAYEGLAWKETIQQLAAEVERLPERERLIIRHHYIGGLTFDQIGAVLGVTKGRVSQMHKAAVGLLRRRLKKAGEFQLQR